MSSEAMFFAGAVIVLLAGAVLLGWWLAGRVGWRHLPLVGALAAAMVLALGTGPLGGRAVTAVAATVLWGVLLLATVIVVMRVRPRLAAAVAGALGGLVAVQAGMVAFVVARFSAAEAPREFALLWLPAATTGAVKDLGESTGADVTPLWVRMSQDAGLLPLLLILLTGFTVAYVLRRGVAARRPTVPA